NDQESRIIQKDTDQGYETFTSKAAQGRGMNIDDLKKIASGRVWSGSQAVDNGLVDILGGLGEAIEIAAGKADILEDYKVRYYPKQTSVYEQLLEDLSGEAETKATKEQLGFLYPYFIQYQKIKHLQGRQARIPFDVEIN
ncbi:MAG: S49 family peptidase, partial [Bacteroidota bacterium]